MTANRRRRGVVLSPAGERKLHEAMAQLETDENLGRKLTIEELSNRTGLDPGTVAKVLDAEQGCDRRTLDRFFSTFALQLTEADFCKPHLKVPSTEDLAANSPGLPTTPTPITQTDWGEAADVSIFYGRTAELTTLEQWLLRDRCRLAALLGMGGIGKTALSIKLSQQLQPHFDYLIWRSLREAPPVEKILADLLKFLSNQQIARLPDNLGDSFTLLISYLQSSRCLIVLDNGESILQEGVQTGHYRDGYEGYGALLQRIGESAHQSSLIITSREKPKEFARLEGPSRSVRTFALSGLQAPDGEAFLQAEGLSVGNGQWRQVFDHYGGNPLALKIAATTIQDLFGGDIEEFLGQGGVVFGEINDLLDQQFDRLTEDGKAVMTWLAINREPTTLKELRADMLDLAAPKNWLNTLESLRRRSLIERTPAGFTLQNVVMEYVTSRWVADAIEALRTGDLTLLSPYALIKAEAKDYVRETQVRLILHPVAASLVSPQSCLRELMTNLHDQPHWSTGYAAGNLLNLLCHVSPEVVGVDLSQLTLRQAFLKGQTLHRVNFSQCHFINPVLNHTFGVVLSVAFSIDGQLLATGNGKGEVLLWHVDRREYLATLRGHIDWVRGVVFTPDGQQLISCGDDHTIRIWDMVTYQCLHILEGHEEDVLAIAISPDGKLLASAGADQTIRIWDLKTFQCSQILEGHTRWIWALAISPDNQYLASAGADHTIQLWDLDTYQRIATLREHTGWISSLAFSPDSQLLASGSGDCTIRLWDMNQKNCIQILKGHRDDIATISFSRNGELLASSGDDRTVRIWDMKTQRCVQVFHEHTHHVRGVCFSPVDNLLASGGFDNTIRLWNTHDRTSFHVFKGHTNGFFCVKFHPDGNQLAGVNEDLKTRIWDLKTYKQLPHLNQPNHSSALAYSPDGKMLAGGYLGYSVQVIDLNSQNRTHLFEGASDGITGHSDWVSSMTFSPNGQVLASNGQDGTVRLWNLEDGSQILLDGKAGQMHSVDFSPDGRSLISGGSDMNVRIWDLVTNTCLDILSGHTSWIRSVKLHPAGDCLATCGDDRAIRLWNVAERKCIHVFDGHTSCVSSVTFDPKGQLLASGSYDQTVRLWDMETYQCLHVFRAHYGRVHSVAFSPDGQILASASEDGSIRLWDVTTKVCLQVLRAPRPYEGSNINGITGLTTAQRESMIALGAVDAVSASS